MNNLTPTICQILITRIGKENRISMQRILGQLDILSPGHDLKNNELADIIHDIRIEGRIQRLILNDGWYISNDLEELKSYIEKYDNSKYIGIRNIIGVLKVQVKEYEEYVKEFG